jgi:hypothetical protein
MMVDQLVQLSPFPLTKDLHVAVVLESNLVTLLTESMFQKGTPIEPIKVEEILQASKRKEKKQIIFYSI